MSGICFKNNTKVEVLVGVEMKKEWPFFTTIKAGCYVHGSS